MKNQLSQNLRLLDEGSWIVLYLTSPLHKNSLSLKHGQSHRPPLPCVKKFNFYWEWGWQGSNSCQSVIEALTPCHWPTIPIPKCLNLLREDLWMVLYLRHTFSKNSFNLKLMSMVLLNIRTFFWTSSNFNTART